MYTEVKDINHTTIQSCVFMSLSELHDGLVKRMKLQIDVSDMTSFKEEYILKRKSHKSLLIDPTLVENEIGGVILGSLKSAELCRPLKWNEYEVDPRSNITKQSDEGSYTRRQIYEQYQSYDNWKKR